MKAFSILICFFSFFIFSWAGKPTTRQRLRSIEIPKLVVKDQDLSEVLKELTRTSQEADPLGKGVQFTLAAGHFLDFQTTLRDAVAGPLEHDEILEPDLIPTPRKRADAPERITMTFGKSTLWNLLDQICAVSGNDYSIRPDRRVYIFRKHLKEQAYDIRCYPLDKATRPLFANPEAIALVLSSIGIESENRAKTMPMLRIHKPSGYLVARLSITKLHLLEKRYPLEPLLVAACANSVTAKSAIWQFMFARLERVVLKERNMSRVMLDMKQIHSRQYPTAPKLDFGIRYLSFPEVPKWSCDLHAVSAMDVVNANPCFSWAYMNRLVAGVNPYSVCDVRVPIDPEIFGEERNNPLFTAKAWFEGYSLSFGMSPNGQAYTVKWDREANHLYLYLSPKDAYHVLKLIAMLDVGIQERR